MTDSIALKLVQRLNKLVPFFDIKADRKLYRPLLSDNEIIELLQQVVNKQKSAQQKHDIAHRQMGSMLSMFRGQGIDYEESRHYQPGDDPRYMNWQLTAKTGQHYMKIFREERQPSVFILLDRRNSMRFGTQQRLKITQAVRAAAVVAFTAHQNNLSVGGVILDSKPEWFKENQNKQAAFDFIHQAARPASPGFNDMQSAEPELDDILKAVSVILTKGTLVYLISDFFDLDEKSRPTLVELTSSHEVKAIQITDPAEIQLPQAGIVSLKSAAKVEPLFVDSNSAAQRKEYETASSQYFSQKKSLFKNSAVAFQQILTTTSAIEKDIIFQP